MNTENPRNVSQIWVQVHFYIFISNIGGEGKAIPVIDRGGP
jgi:hypothetical protein